MKSTLNKCFSERLTLLTKNYADKPLQVVGISRLAKFDPINMCTKPDMTEEDELKFYEMWCAQYSINYPLAVGAKDDDGLIDAWAGYVVPYFVLVGKDGNVTYMRTGKGTEHFAALREMLDKAMAGPKQGSRPARRRAEPRPPTG